MPVLDAKALPGTSRSNSLASTVSSSGASLTRRSRTKTRTRTATAGPSKEHSVEDEVLDISAAYTVDAASASGHLCGPLSPSLSETSPITPHSAGDRGSTNGSDDKRLRDGSLSPQCDDGLQLDGVRGRGLHSEKFSLANSSSSKGKARAPIPPRLTSPPSAFRPSPNTEGDNVRSTVRDSLLTQQSSTSSSIYPASTNTESPPSPRSPIVRELDQPLSFDIEGQRPGNGLEYDTEYRLRLLVKNNYFLPPAHSKPSPSDFAPSHSPTSPNLSSKKPAFLDLFRVGKSKPAVPAPENEPMLRVTSDATAAPGHAPQVPLHHSFPFHADPMARVVVVREKMDDLISAAKQAEADVKAREAVREAEPGSRLRKPDLFDGIIDPTDAVDVPMPSPDYPLALQASALHGMGIEDSVGAAVLADRLPPPYSPGPSSIDPREDAWRKALLHAAVGHSLNNSLTSISFSASSPTPARTPRHPRSSDSLHHRALQQQRRQLDQKILANPLIDAPESEGPSSPLSSPLASHPLTPVNPRSHLTAGCLAIPEEQRLSSLSYAPRAETPVPQTPLAPPPVRKYLGSSQPQYSLSQTDLPDRQGASSSDPHKAIRKTFSSPMLSDSYEKSGARGFDMTPPPLPSLGLNTSHSPAQSSVLDPHRMSTMTGLSRYTSSEQDDEPAPRPSLALSLPTTDGRRPSVSEYSQPSPTVSAFQDRWGSDGYFSASSQPPLPRSRDPSREPPPERQSPPSHLPRLSTLSMSPPPRPSSSLAGVALSPPPHRSPYHPSISTSRIPRPPPSRSSSDHTFRSFRSLNSSAIQRPPIPTPLMLNVSVDTFASLHSAPPPASPAAFFDHIQGHPNAMDDLDESDDEDCRSDGDGFGTDQDVTAVYSPSHPSHKPSLTRLGNMSTPNVAHSSKDPGPFLNQGIPLERKQPIGNIPSRAPYFSSVKGSPDSITPLKLAQYSREHLLGESSSREQLPPRTDLGWQESTPPPPKRPTTAGAAENVRRWQMDVEQSSRRLDGMVVKHMEAERDTLKRIAGAAKVPRA
ncbi:hypothetical protein BV22DRAFT_81771 [Leucogyrophana mollusca]|uniref:Uncharacterized protein n=1 Tax=Leucogyrophana mollusca TaxID=85980 RepID=A0ACB8BXQ9_9AGAM|nr:hypothetical protein BV22DRAFT_81771 [Leucogyrophana mollusca]